MEIQFTQVPVFAENERLRVDITVRRRGTAIETYSLEEGARKLEFTLQDSTGDAMARCEAQTGVQLGAGGRKSRASITLPGEGSTIEVLAESIFMVKERHIFRQDGQELATVETGQPTFSVRNGFATCKVDSDGGMHCHVDDRVDFSLDQVLGVLCYCYFLIAV